MKLMLFLGFHKRGAAIVGFLLYVFKPLRLLDQRFNAFDVVHLRIFKPKI